MGGLGLIGLVVAAPPAAAHAVVVSSSPPDGADLAAAPARVSITFDESVGLRPGYLQVIDGSGRVVDTGAAYHPPGHDDIVTVGLRRGLGRAAYVASYRVVSADSHPVEGVVRFTVGGARPATGAAGAVTDRTVPRVLDAARTVSFAGLALLGGAWLLLVRRRPWADEPAGSAGGGPGGSAGGGPDVVRGVVRDTVRAGRRGWLGVRAGAGLAAAALAVEFVLQGPYAAGRGLGRALDPTLLGDTLDTSFGRWHLIAIVLVLGLGAATVFRPASARRPAALVVAAAAWLVVLTAVAAGGHAGVQAPVWLGLPVTVLHLLTMTTWIGGLAVLAGSVLAGSVPASSVPASSVPAGSVPAAGGEPGADVAWADSVLPLFSRVALLCVIGLGVTGTYQAWREVGSWWALGHTTYGALVLVKIALFLVLVGLGAVARGRVRSWPGPERGPGPLDAAMAAGARRIAAARRLRAGVVAEIVIAVAVLGVSGVLVAEPPGRNAVRPEPPVAVTAPLTASRSATVVVTPGRHGLVDVAVSVTPGPRVQALTLTATQAARSIGPLPVPLVSAAGGYHATAVDLPVAGAWTFTITVQTSAFDIATATPTLDLR